VRTTRHNAGGATSARLCHSQPVGPSAVADDACMTYRMPRMQVGHAGTLDPMATGLLIVCCGKATKQVDLYQAMDKLYTGTLKLGEATPSYDAETEVEERLPWEHITDAQLIDAAATFLGQIDQVCTPWPLAGFRVFFNSPPRKFIPGAGLSGLSR
jgi:tRNA U55 pseudouridine synthase TruB